MEIYLVRSESARPINRFYPSLALATLADIVRKYSDVRIFDLGLNRDGSFIRNVKQHQPDIVGFTTSIDDYGEVLELAGTVKKVSPKSVVVTGGPHVTLLDKYALDSRDVDVTVYGEGEETFPRLVRALETGQNLAEVPGIFYREDGTVKKTQRVGFYNLDNQPLPAWDLYDLSNFFPILPIETSRGCPYQCVYCAEGWINGLLVRKKSVEHVVKEIKHDKEFGVSHFRFVDSTLNFKKGRLPELARAFLDNGLDITWSSYARFETMDDESMRLAKESGCVSFYFGLESGDPSILRIMRNPYNWAHIQHILNLAKELEIHAHCNFIVGFPDETEENVENTLRMMKILKPDSTYISTFFVVPMTKIHRDSTKYGIEFIEPNWISNLHTFFKEPKPYFRHRTMSQEDMRRYHEKIRIEIEGVDGVYWNLKDYPLLTWLAVGGKIDDLKRIWKEPPKFLTEEELKYFEAFKEKEIYEIEQDDERTSRIRDVITTIARKQLLS